MVELVVWVLDVRVIKNEDKSRLRLSMNYCETKIITFTKPTQLNSADEKSSEIHR